MSGRAPYARLSDEDERGGRVSDSVLNQRLEEEEYFERQGWPWDESLYFSDDDRSASKYATKPREGYQDLLAAIRAGRVELILVTEVSRLCRTLVDAVELISLAKESGPFRLVETTGGTRYDLTTVQGEHNFLEDVVGASRESGYISDRVKRTKRARAREGLWGGGSRPYGYRRLTEWDGQKWVNRGRLEILPEEEIIIRELVDRVLAGEHLSVLAHELNAREVPTAAGKRWYPGTIRKLLRKPMLKGVVTLHGTEYPATWPAIVTGAEFERLQVVLGEASRYVNVTTRRRSGWRSYLLTGFIVCGAPSDATDDGICGAKLAGAQTREVARRRMARLEQGRAVASIPPGMTLRQAWDAGDINWRRTILSLVVVKVIVSPGHPGRSLWPEDDSPLLERARANGGPWCFDPSKIDIQWKV